MIVAATMGEIESWAASTMAANTVIASQAGEAPRAASHSIAPPISISTARATPMKAAETITIPSGRACARWPIACRRSRRPTAAAISRVPARRYCRPIHTSAISGTAVMTAISRLEPSTSLVASTPATRPTVIPSIGSTSRAGGGAVRRGGRGAAPAASPAGR